MDGHASKSIWIAQTILEEVKKEVCKVGWGRKSGKPGNSKEKGEFHQNTLHKNILVALI